MTEVFVIGGGIGGLSAAHELAQRGVDVTVFEANDRFGGKARSMPIDDSPMPLHGEHGFRFFPAFYRHVVDTMDRIPLRDGELFTDLEDGPTVADNLVETGETLVASTTGPGNVASVATPESVSDWLETLRPAFVDELPREDVRFLLERLLYLVTACQERRDDELDDVSWWEFIDADNRSEEFRDRLAYATQSLVALRPQVGSARTIGTIYLQLLFGQFDPTRPTEQILNGPTNEAWIDPWIDYLESLGVTLYADSPIERLTFDGRRITGAVVADGAAAPVAGETVTADEYVLAVPVEVAPEFVTPEMASAAPELGRIANLDTAWMNGIQFYLTEDVELVRGHQVYADAPWALTSISQRQFWSDYDVDSRGPEEVAGVLSVIASDWDTPGVLYGKPARECTREEIAAEIWSQVKSHLNVAGDRLTDDMLVDWFLDPAIVETEDGVENRSPLLINTVGSLRNRPPADVAIPNLTLASDYVRTNSDLASMESANEAGRRAANAILERTGYSGRTARIWELEEPAVFDPFKRQDAIRYRLGLPHPAEITQSVRGLTTRLRGRA
ncbi:Phytoene dehydrogenase or related enzyme [Halalkaliarchaeum sp. AArc-CO]|uniref:hydroxysqualene dehydroxylase n=1 Tax=Halalkaliarchaeum sp. AArc-CO TaxID=2866381 RepID=UPI00217CE7B5|nr:FAD-dependent oxidoreductase [Halalkaliarchaeum sp. AArc-CO]UWG50643.1 Phytoene dehydrogenase or related enzyme [Halalkaliarchaeum sp. AArc-CO]